HTASLRRRAVDHGTHVQPTIFDSAIKNSSDYDASIRGKLKDCKTGEALFFELALEDLTQAADPFRPTHSRPAALTVGYRSRYRPCSSAARCPTP
ncbi:MAG TPA: hypothetical protein VGF76_17580, partial [Polyangiaceae bacterium]